jgi:transcription termination factor Rho
MSVLDRASLEQSPLADLHVIASELSLDGYRRLRKEQLIDAILERQGGEEAKSEEPADDSEAEPEQPSARRRRGRRGGRGRGGGRGAATEEPEAEEEEQDEGDRGPRAEGPEEIEQQLDEAREAEDERGGGAEDERGGEAEDERAGAAKDERAGEEVVEGVVELLPNGSAFLRVSPPEPSDEDIYVSAAQVKRCELVTGDRVSGPRRAPRRSERFASLVRVDTINGQAAREVADSARFEDLPAEFPSEHLRLASEDLTITAIAALAPIGRGSRVTIAGDAQSGKTEVLRRLAADLMRDEELRLWLVLAGVRAEEVWEWRDGPLAPAAALTLSASPDAQGQLVEGVVEQARRLAGRGAHTVVLIDTLEFVPPQTARRALAAARKLVDSGSLTVIATAPTPIGGETTVITLDAALARTGQFPALDPATTWTMKRERLSR